MSKLKSIYFLFKNTSVNILFWVGAFCFLAGCDESSEDQYSLHKTNKKHWSYQGETSPEYWEEIESNSECGGTRQSPINIIDFNAVPTEKSEQLEFHYSSEIQLKKAINNGHTVQFEFMSGDYIIYNGTSYNLVQVHFHEHAEHLMSGVVYPVEIHLVHVSSMNTITVLSILGKEGEESEVIELFESFLPLKMGESKTIDVKCDINQLLPLDRTYYS